jgi:hypothetical protein
MPRDLHSALGTETVSEATGGGVRFLLVRLQRGKTDIVHSLHAGLQTLELSRVRTTNFLAHLGFTPSPCAFLPAGDCLVRKVDGTFDVGGFARGFADGWSALHEADRHLNECGLQVTESKDSGVSPDTDGHTAPVSRKLKESSDDVFSYVLSWLTGDNDKGWTLHYRPKHLPLSLEIEAALAFLGGFREFRECPQFGFESCHWRFYPFADKADDPWDSHTEHVHSLFDAHATHFSPGLRLLLAAHAAVKPFGMNVLSIPPPLPVPAGPSHAVASTQVGRQAAQTASADYRYDVALSFAGPQRPLADVLATTLRDSGITVFYDDFYPEHLWGKDLASYFDRVYRKEARFCVIFVSGEYKTRAWTYHELRSALARALEERGREYILPIQVEPVELEGIPPTLGYVSLSRYSIEQIAELLLRKLKAWRPVAMHRDDTGIHIEANVQVTGQDIYVVIRNDGATDEFVAQVVRVSGDMTAPPAVPWSTRWRDTDLERCQILRGQVRSLLFAQYDAGGRVDFFEPSRQVVVLLGVDRPDEAFSKSLSVIVRVASVSGRGAVHKVVRIKFNHDFAPRATMSEARPRSERHADRVIFRDPDGKEWRHSYVKGLSDDELVRLRDQRPEVYRTFEEEESDRMGPPGKPGALWDDEFQDPA